MKITSCILACILAGIPRILPAQICSWQPSALFTNYTQTTGQAKVLPNPILYIPVVIHSIYNNDIEKVTQVQVANQISVLNKAFAAELRELETVESQFKPFIGSSSVQFYVVRNSRAGEPLNGIQYVPSGLAVQQPSTIYSKGLGQPAWNPDEYLNIWVANLGGIAYGWAQAIGSGAQDGEGVVVDYQWFGNKHSPSEGKTLVHEVGHYLGLQHTWGLGGCDNDDGIADTPMQAGPAECGSQKISCESPDMSQNFMNQASEACLLFFTKGQVGVMQANLAMARPSLASNLVPLALEYANFDDGFQLKSIGNELVITASNFNVSQAKVEIYTMQGHRIELEKAKPLQNMGVKCIIPLNLKGLFILCLTIDKKSYRKKILLENRI